MLKVRQKNFFGDLAFPPFSFFADHLMCNKAGRFLSIFRPAYVLNKKKKQVFRILRFFFLSHKGGGFHGDFSAPDFSIQKFEGLNYV